MKRAKITAIDKDILGVEVQVKGSGIGIMKALAAIIDNVAEIDEKFAFTAIIAGIENSDKKNELYKLLEWHINSQKGSL